MPEVAESVSQFAFLEAVQFSGVWPVFEILKVALAGVNGPPYLPLELSPDAGVRVSTGSSITLSDTGRVVFPLLFVTFVKVTVSVKVPPARLFAFALMLATTVALAPGASVPLVAESVTQFADFAAVQSMGELPELVTV